MRSFRLFPVVALVIAATSCQVPAPPVALNDVTTTAAALVDVDVVANDFVTGTEYTIDVISGPTCGEVVDVGSSVLVEVGAECGETVTFEYQVVDQHGRSGTAQVTINVDIAIQMEVLEFLLPTAVATAAPVPTETDISDVEVVKEPDNGVLVGQDDQLVYIPAEGLRGTDHFELAVRGGTQHRVYEVQILELRADPGQVSFPPTRTGTRVEAVVAVENVAAFTFDFEIQPPQSPFSIEDRGNCASPLVPGDRCAFVVAFLPEADGAYQTEIGFPYGGSVVTVPVAGSAGQPDLVFGLDEGQPVELIGLPITKAGIQGSSLPIALINGSPVDSGEIAEIVVEPADVFYVENLDCGPSLAQGQHCNLEVGLTGTIQPVVAEGEPLERIDTSLLDTPLIVVPRAILPPPQDRVVNGTLIALDAAGDLLAASSLEGTIGFPRAQLRAFDKNDVELDVAQPIPILDGDSTHFVIENTSLVPVTLADASIEPEIGSEDVYSLTSDQCAPGDDTNDLPPGETCEVVVSASYPQNAEYQALFVVSADTWRDLFARLERLFAGPD